MLKSSNTLKCPSTQFIKINVTPHLHPRGHLPTSVEADLHTLADFSQSLGHLNLREGAEQAGACSV